MIYGFISDCTLWKDISIANSSKELNQGVGFPSDLVLNYFIQTFIFKDTRQTRDSTILENISLKKGLRVIADDTKNTEDLLKIQDLTDEEKDKFFLILEKIYLSQNKLQADINTELSNDDRFSIYKKDSLQISANSIDILVINNDGEETVLKIYDWFQITLITTSGTIELRLWLNEQAFLNAYPISTIVKVILPCDPEYIINNDRFITKVDALVKSSEFSFTESSNEIGTTDHTGMIVYKTKYVLSSTNINQLPFGILYKGSMPGSLEIREAIRNELATYTLIPQSVWETLLPELFIEAQFFIVPIWDHTTVRPDRTLYPSVINYYSIQGKVLAILPEAYRNGFFRTYFEVLMCGYSEIFSGIISNPLNKEGYFSFYNIHPTYQYHNSTDASFAYMEERTKLFNLKFNKCIAILQGETTSSLGEYIENIFNGKRWLSFSVENVEYHVLRKEDFTGEIYDGDIGCGEIEIYNQLFIRGVNAAEMKASVTQG